MRHFRWFKRSHIAIRPVRFRIGAVVVAAGLSRRMGQPKVLLEWGAGRTILDHILICVKKAHLDQIIVVTGHRADEVALIAQRQGVETCFNPNFEVADMLSSLKVGIAALDSSMDAVLIVLGDQPMVRTNTIRRVMRAYQRSHMGLVIPSYQMQRGHPIVLDRRYWGEVLALDETRSLRDVIKTHNDAIYYVNVDDDHILRDIDTPDAYNEAKQRAGL